MNKYRLPRLTVYVSGMWAGLDSTWEQEKLEARKMLLNRADSQTSAACLVRRIHGTQDSIPEKRCHRKPYKIISQTLAICKNNKIRLAKTLENQNLSPAMTLTLTVKKDLEDQSDIICKNYFQRKLSQTWEPYFLLSRGLGCG